MQIDIIFKIAGIGILTAQCSEIHGEGRSSEFGGFGWTSYCVVYSD